MTVMKSTKVAREEYGMIKDGKIHYRVVLKDEERD